VSSGARQHTQGNRNGKKKKPLISACTEISRNKSRRQGNHTDRTILNNRPDITIRDNEKGTCMLIDVAISEDRNMIKKEADEILNIKTLEQKYSALGM
jgi:hypothetical protein